MDADSPTQFTLDGETIKPTTKAGKAAMEILAKEGPAAASMYLEDNRTSRNATEVDMLEANMWDIEVGSNLDEFKLSMHGGSRECYG